MSEQENKGSDTPKPPDRSRRAVILATVGIVVILGVAVFYVAVIAPFLKTRAVVREPPFALVTSNCIERLGGERAALRRLSFHGITTNLANVDWLFLNILSGFNL